MRQGGVLEQRAGLSSRFLQLATRSEFADGVDLVTGATEPRCLPTGRTRTSDGGTEPARLRRPRREWGIADATVECRQGPGHSIARGMHGELHEHVVLHDTALHCPLPRPDQERHPRILDRRVGQHWISTPASRYRYRLGWHRELRWLVQLCP